ncbi:MAG: hypothetical protein ACPG31_01335 [Planctomycetota bacterium]
MFCALFLLTSTALAQDPTVIERITPDEKVFLRTECIMPKVMLPGYFPVKITLENRRDVALDLDLALGNHRNWGTQTLTSGTMHLEAGETKTVEWLAFQFGDTTSRTTELRVTRDGGRQLFMEAVHQVDGTLGTGSHGRSTPMLAVSASSTNFGRSLHGKTTRNHEVVASQCAPKDLPTDWRAYSALSYVALDLNSSPPSAAQLEAILAWTSTGGNFLLIGTEDQARALVVDFDNLLDDSSLISGSLPLNPTGLNTFRHGFGRIELAPDTNCLDRLLAPVLDDSSLVVQGVDQEDHDKDDVFAAGTFTDGMLAMALKIPGLEHAPPSLLVLILLVFVLFVGPVQFLRSKRKKHSPFRFLIVTPIVGIGCAILIVGGSLVHQGLSVKESVVSMTWLDQETHMATTLAKRYTFSGSLFRDNLKYTGQTAALASEHNFLGSSNRKFHYDLDSGGSLRGDFMPVRFPAPQSLATVATSRGRVHFEVEGDTTYALNGLDTTLATLSYRPAPGRYLMMPTDQSLEPGGRIALIEVGELPAMPMPRVVDRHTVHDLVALGYTSSSSMRLSGLGYGGSSAPSTTHPDQPQSTIMQNLMRMHDKRFYIGLMEESPFVEDGGVERETISQKHVLIGVLGEEGA